MLLLGKATNGDDIPSFKQPKKSEIFFIKSWSIDPSTLPIWDVVVTKIFAFIMKERLDYNLKLQDLVNVKVNTTRGAKSASHFVHKSPFSHIGQIEFASSRLSHLLLYKCPSKTLQKKNTSSVGE